MSDHDLEQALTIAKQLSPIEKVQLIERVMATLKEDLSTPKVSKQSLNCGN